MLSATSIVLAADTSPTSWRSFNLALVYVAQTTFLFLGVFSQAPPWISLLIAQACWILYLSYLALFLCEAPNPIAPSVAQPVDLREHSTQVRISEPRLMTWTLWSLSKAITEPAKLFFVKANQTLFWIGFVVFSMPAAGYLFWDFGNNLAEAYHKHFAYYVSVQLVQSFVCVLAILITVLS